MRRRYDDPAEKVWNPYSWRLREVAGLGPHPVHVARRRQLLGELIWAEASELARGIRHVSVVHGVPAGRREADRLDRFLDGVDATLAGVAWSRRCGEDDHLIVAVGGPDADDRVGRLVTLAARYDPGHWVVTESPRPVLPVL